MANTMAQSQLTPPLASLQFLRPYTKEQAAALSPDLSGKLFSLGDLGKNHEGMMFGLEDASKIYDPAKPIDPATMFTPEYMNQVASGQHGVPPWAPPWLVDRIGGVSMAGGNR
jgi:hypothetical protein